MKDNELIAEFMGGHRQEIGADKKYGYESGTVLWWNIFHDDSGPLTHLEFDISWDWLMPVVEKISDMMPHINIPDDLEALKNGTHGSEQHIEVLSLPISSKITEVHEAVVKFITWYNSQPSPPSEQKPNEGPIDEYYFIKGPE
jgi:hypothetical protein